MCEHAALCLLFLLGNECLACRVLCDSLRKTATVCPDLAVCDLGLVVPKPEPQFPPFQNAEYSYVVTSVSTGST